MSAAKRALAAVLVPKPDRPKLPVVGIASGLDVAPVTYSVTPAVDVMTGKPCPVAEVVASARRPPHPVRETPDAIALCHSPC